MALSRRALLSTSAMVPAAIALSSCAVVGEVTGALSSKTLGSLIDLVLAAVPGLNTVAATVDAGITAVNAVGIISGVQTGLGVVQDGFLALAGFLGVSAATQAAETAIYSSVETALAGLSANSPPTTIGGVVVDAFSLISQIISGAQAAGAVSTSVAVTTPTAPAAAAAARFGAPIGALHIQFQKQYS